MDLHNEKLLTRALSDLRSKKVKSIAAAARKWDVNRNTLRNRLTKKHGPRKGHGEHPLSKLSKPCEKVLYDWVTRLSMNGTSPEPAIVKTKAEQLCGEPLGVHWVTRFVKRYPELKSRISQRMDRERMKAEDREIFQAYFDKFNDLVTSHGFTKETTWNMDQKGFLLGRGRRKRTIINIKVARREPRNLGDSARENISCFGTVCADGSHINPLLVYKGLTVNPEWFLHYPGGKSLVTSAPKGVTNDNISFKWLKDVFEPQTRDKANGRKRLLILDQHGSHMTQQFVEFALEHDIYCFHYPAHTTHLLQPCDVGIFNPLAAAYDKQLDRVLRESQGFQSIRKAFFYEFFEEAWKASISETVVKRAWRDAGLFPYNPRKVIDKLPRPVETTPPPEIAEIDDGRSLRNLRITRNTPVNATPRTAGRYRQLADALMIMRVNERHRQSQQEAYDRAQELRNRPNNRQQLQGNGAILWDHEKLLQLKEDASQRALDQLAVKAARQAEKAEKQHMKHIKQQDKQLKKALAKEQRKRERINAKKRKDDVRDARREIAASFRQSQGPIVPAATPKLAPTSSGRVRRSPRKLRD